MTAMSKAHTEHGIAHVKKREKSSEVSVRATMRLNVCVFAPEEFFRTLDSEVLHLVHVRAPAVVTLAGIAFGVLIGELTALGRHHGRRSIVFACNHFDVLFLTLHFVFDVLPDFGVGDGGSFAVFKHGKVFLRVS